MATPPRAASPNDWQMVFLEGSNQQPQDPRAAEASHITVVVIGSQRQLSPEESALYAKALVESRKMSQELALKQKNEPSTISRLFFSCCPCFKKINDSEKEI